MGVTQVPHFDVYAIRLHSHSLFAHLFLDMLYGSIGSIGSNILGGFDYHIITVDQSRRIV